MKQSTMREIGRTRSGLRLGWTTGSCAAAAAKAAAQMLFSGEEICQVRLMTPKGIELDLDVEHITRTPDYVQCAVRKYSGDDPDVTDGLLIYAKVEKQEEMLDEEIEKMIEERQAARKAKDFAKADAIRDALLEKGIILKDTREGVQWKKA